MYKEIQDTLKGYIEFAQAVAANPSFLDHNVEQPDAIQIGERIYTKDSANSL